MAYRQAGRKTSPFGLPAFKLPNGTRYRSTGADGTLGLYGANLPKNLFNGQVGVGGINQTPSTPNLGVYNNSPYMGFQTPTSSTYSGRYEPNRAAFTGTMTPQGFRTPTSTTPFNIPPPYTGTAGYWGAYNANQNAFTGTMTPEGFRTPTSTTPFKSKQAQRPQGTFTGDPNDPNTQKWIDYWNAAAANPNSVQPPNQGGGEGGQAPRVMSRSEIWEMKAEQRRRRNAEEAWDLESGGGYDPTPPPKWSQLKASSMSLNFRVGAG